MNAAGRRSGLVLAGGGIRVAWQTGVVAALTEAGHTFAHVDGTSGGIFTAAMLLSGRSPEEMGERWRRLDVRSFLSPLPLRSYLRSPTDWTAFGGSRGIRQTVLPALGIDLDRVRARSAPTGSFNVADFTTKRCVPIAHTEIDEDRLIAGVSLPGVMPAVEHGGRTWTDAVWIKDANLTETVRRGCTDLWVAWCISNTPRWGNGALEQYVHMIEMSAAAGLLTELEWIADLNARRARGEAVLGSTDQVVVHLVKPALPIPLDPDFVTGRIDAETLIAMGYRDAWRYLDRMTPDGVALDWRATATPARALGARVVLRSDGALRSGGPASCTLVLEADDLRALAADPAAEIPAVGGFRDLRSGHRLFRGAVASLRAGSGDAPVLCATAAVRRDGTWHRLDVEAPLATAARRQQWVLRDERGSVVDRGAGRMSWGRTVRALASFEPSGASDLRDRVRAAGLAVDVLRRSRPQRGGVRAGAAGVPRPGGAPGR
jgi:predicted acylesterase/phospholipase RssA